MKSFFRLNVIVGALPVTLQNGTTADATQVMSDLNWIVNQVNANAAPLVGTALTNANNNFTVVQSGIAASAAANFPIASQVQNSVFTTFQSTLGTNALTARCAALPLTAWPTDAVFSFIPSQTNTGPANITVDSAGSSILFSMGSALIGGELRIGVPAFVKRDATKLNLTNPANVRFDLASSATSSAVRILISGTPVPITIGMQPAFTQLAVGGTYTIRTGCVRLKIRMVGGGGGGGGGGAGTSAGTAGGTTIFGPLTAVGGGAGQDGGGGNIGGAGGVASGAQFNASGDGGNAGTGAGTNGGGGKGGSSLLGGGGPSGSNAGGTGGNYGGGGGGGGTSPSTNTGGGGGGGGYCEHTFVIPQTSFNYIVGGGGTAGGGSNPGAVGANGTILVEESYN